MEITTPKQHCPSCAGTGRTTKRLAGPCETCGGWPEDLRAAVDAAVLAEREACAKVAEDTLVDGLILEGVRFGSSVRAAIVAAIRARR